jgi:hypothetical protein
MGTRISISVGQDISDRDPGYMIHSAQYATSGAAVCFNEDWRTGIPKLKERIAPAGPIVTDIEINCHGENARLLLLPTVDFTNLALFASQISTLAMPGGRIHLFACKVCGLGPNYVRARTMAVHRMRGSAIPDAQVGLDPVWNQYDALNDQSPYMGRGKYMERFNTIALLPVQLTTIMQGAIASGSQKLEREYQVEQLVDVTKPGGKVVEEAVLKRRVAVSLNGPLFCSQLARATGCTVRASTLVQEEEGDAMVPTGRYMHPFGEWEGLVFDFLPNGNVRFVGDNPSRFLDRDVDHSGFKGFERLA